MAIGQLASTGKENNKIYRITIFNGMASSDRGIHFYASQKIENLSGLKSYVSNYGYTFAGSTWKYIDVCGYYSSTHASKIFLTQGNDMLLMNIDSSQTSLSSATFICSEI